MWRFLQFRRIIGFILMTSLVIQFWRCKIWYQNSKFNYVFREDATKMIIKYILIISLIQTAFVIRCSSKNVRGCGLNDVGSVHGRWACSVAFTQSVADTCVSCPVLADMRSTELKQSGSKADHRYFGQLRKRGTFTRISTCVFMAW